MDRRLLFLASFLVLVWSGCVTTQPASARKTMPTLVYASIPQQPTSSHSPPTSGTCVVRVRTNHQGNIVAVHFVRSTGSVILDRSTVEYIVMHWHGPPDSVREIEFAFSLH